MMTHKSDNMGMSLLLGLGIGLAAGVLFAPRKGEETRQQIKQKAMEIRGKAMEARDRITDRVSDQAEEMGEMANKTADELARHTRQTTAKLATTRGKDSATENQNQ